MIDLSKYHNHSGGARGSDTEWDLIGREYGFMNHKHYRISDLQQADQKTRDIIEKDVHDAAIALCRPPSEFRGKDLVRRNWFQVENGQRIYAIGEIVEPDVRDSRGLLNKAKKQVVAGGTGWAVEMAIQKGYGVAVFDQRHKLWYFWDFSLREFLPGDYAPILSYDYAGIGTRNIMMSGKQAIRDVYIETLKVEQKRQEEQHGKSA